MRPVSALAIVAATSLALCGLGLPAAAQTTRKSTAHQPQAAPVHPSPPIVVSPQITVPPAPPPAITVQPAAPAITITPPAPASDPTKWIALFIAVASAGVSVISMLIAWRSQTMGLRKDAAAIVRDLKAKEANAVIQAFENNVARPIGTLLDHIERLTNELLKMATADPAQVMAEEAKYATQLSLDRGNMLRLCREADGSLARDRPQSPFAAAFVGMGLDVTLFRSGSAVLRGDGPAEAIATTLDEVARMRVDLRTLLESERAEQIRLTIGDITDDPYYPEIERYLGRQITTRLPNRAQPRTP